MDLRRLAMSIGSVTLAMIAAAGSGFACAPTDVPTWKARDTKASDEEKSDEDAEDPEEETTPRSSSPKSGQTDASTFTPIPTDAGPTSPMTFPIGGNGCDGARCGGGSDGRKSSDAMPTADKLCRDRGFARASDFTITPDEPGGRFCSWRGTAWGCDQSCSSCNPIASVTCTPP